MQDRTSSIVMVHEIKVTFEEQTIMKVKNFSSLKFSQLYLKSPFPATLRFDELDYSEEYYKLQQKIDDMVDYININAGFTVIGWYKRGEINDASNKENENDVDAGDIGYHIVSLYPTSSVVLNSDDFKNNQFDTNSIHH